MRRGLVTLALALGALHPGTAHAQAQSQVTDRRLTEGVGIKAGDFELHPALAAEFGYDTNYFQRSGDRGIVDGVQIVDESPAIAAWRLRITPSMTFQTFGRRAHDEKAPERDIEVSGGLSGSYNALFAADSRFAEDVSRQDHFAGNADVGLNIGPRQKIGGDLRAGATRMVEPSNNPEVFQAFRRDVYRLGAGLNIRPGGGTFTWRFGYGFLANVFEEQSFTGYDNIQHRVEAGGTWKFLPRTALIYRGDITFVTFVNNPKTLSDGQTARTELGINGLVTNYFGFLAMAGWGGTFFDNKPKVGAENFDSLIGQVELTWYPEPQKWLPLGEQPVGLSSGSVGYTRNFTPSYLGNYYTQDRGYVNVVYLFGQKFVTGFSAGFSHITRPPSYFPDGSYRIGSQGGDNRVDLMAFLEYRLMPTLGLNLTGRYDAAVSRKLVELVQGPPPLYDELTFSRFQVFVGARWFY